MNNRENILAIVPARGGSKGAPRKNVRALAGKPLIYYTLREALESQSLERVVVSTEDDEIARVSKQYGAEVVARPAELATDEAKTIDVIFHALSTLEKQDYTPAVVVLLQPTSPLRSRDDIDKAIDLFSRNDCDSVVSISEFSSVYWSFKIEGGYLKPLFGEKFLRTMRQGLEKAYIPNGAIYIAPPSVLYHYRSFYGQKTIPYIMPSARSIDIDSETEFKIAEILMKGSQ